VEKIENKDKVLTLNVDTLKWAASKKGDTLEAFVRSLYAKETTVQSILKGQLTFPQIKKFSDAAGVPFGFLLLKKPPEEYEVNKEFVDFRTVRNNSPLSKDFLEVYKDIEHKQSWFKKYQQELGVEKLPFVGKYKERESSNKDLIARDIRNTIGIDGLRKSVKSSEQYLSAR
jgi:hypothetical protein